MEDIPAFFVTDRGGEFYNRKVKKCLDEYGIKHYSINGKSKACVAERFIRTLKSRLEKYFWHNKTRNWIDVLPQFVENYNNTPHRSIGTTPNKVTEKNQREIFEKLYPNYRSTLKPRLGKGDKVRILRQKSLFEKGYTQSWRNEIYIITKAFTSSGVDYYKVSTRNGVILPQSRYYWELNLVSKAEDDD